MRFAQACNAVWSDSAQSRCDLREFLSIRHHEKGASKRKQRPSGEEVRRALLVLIGNREEECCQSHQGALGGGVRCLEVCFDYKRAKRIWIATIWNGTHDGRAWLARFCIIRPPKKWAFASQKADKPRKS